MAILAKFLKFAKRCMLNYLSQFESIQYSLHGFRSYGCLNLKRRVSPQF